MSQERFTAFISKLSGFDLNNETVTTILQKAVNEVYETPASPKRSTSLWQAFVKKTVPTLKTEIGDDGKPLSTKDRMRRTADLWGSLTDEDKVKLSEELGCSWKPSKEKKSPSTAPAVAPATEAAPTPEAAAAPAPEEAQPQVAPAAPRITRRK